MRLVIPILEIQEFLSEHYNIKIDLKNIAEDKIEATYFDEVVLIITEVKHEVVYLRYEVDGLAGIGARIAHYFLDKKLDNIPVDWNAKAKEITIDLKRIPDLRDLLKLVYISDLNFKNDNIEVIFHVRAKT